MSITLQKNETIIKEGPANHFMGAEGVGGKLYLTNQRVFFKSHSFNIQNHELSIAYDKIKDVGKRSTFFIIPNGMYIETTDGNIEKFVLWRRKEWIDEIKKRIESQHTS